MYSRKEALNLWGMGDTTPDYEVNDKLDQILFESKDYILRNTIIPRIAVKRIERIQQSQEIAALILNKEETTETDNVSPGEQVMLDEQSPLEMFRQYESKMSTAKLGLATSRTTKEVCQRIYDLIELQTGYFTQVKKCIEGVTVPDSVLKEVVLSQQIPSSEIIQELLEKEFETVSSWDTFTQSFPRMSQEVARVIKLSA